MGTEILQMFSYIVAVIAVLGTVVYFWRFGHKGEWGKLSAKYKSNRKEIGAIKGIKQEAIYIKISNRWVLWSSFGVIFKENALCFYSIPVYSFLVPSVCIPWGNITLEDEIRPKLIKHIAVYIKDCDVKIAINYKYKQKLFESLT